MRQHTTLLNHLSTIIHWSGQPVNKLTEHGLYARALADMMGKMPDGASLNPVAVFAQAAAFYATSVEGFKREDLLGPIRTFVFGEYEHAARVLAMPKPKKEAFLIVCANCAMIEYQGDVLLSAPNDSSGLTGLFGWAIENGYELVAYEEGLGHSEPCNVKAPETLERATWR